VNVNGGIIPPRKTGEILRKSWNCVNIVPLTGNIPCTKRPKLNEPVLKPKFWNSLKYIELGV
jgi:hypothetical protein